MDPNGWRLGTNWLKDQYKCLSIKVLLINESNTHCVLTGVIAVTMFVSVYN